MIALVRAPPEIYKPNPKRRKLDNTIQVSRNKLITEPSTPAPIDEDDNIDTSITATECPCGFLHGPGMDHNHDITAVGMSSNMMRGPA